MRPSVIDAFAGAGGISLGLKWAGWQPALAFDHEAIAVQTYLQNLGGNCHLLDAREVSGSDLLEMASLKVGECELLAGGPPCQGFSLQGRGNRNDQRNLLTLKFVNWIEQIQPKAFLMENVPAITTVRGRHLVESLQRKSGELGYRCSIRTLNAADYGVPQIRRRTFMVGIKAGHFTWPLPSGEPPTVMEAIGELPTPPEDGSAHPDFFNHYRESRLSALNKERLLHIPEGGGREFLPDHLTLDCHRGDHRHLDTYGRLAWDRPSGTITGGFDSFTRGRFAHPEDHRSITLREGARLQGFPDWFNFLGNREEGARMIGNAVPPPLAKCIGVAVKDAIVTSANLPALQRTSSSP